jgi:predicted DNA-binding transcriptional regulator
MAKLEDLMPNLKNELMTLRHSANTKKQTKYTPQKRRAWFEENDLNKNLQEKPSNKRGVSTPLQNEVDEPLSSTSFINPIHQPHLAKGGIEGGYKPLLISLSQLRSNPLQLILFLYSRTDKEKNSVKTNEVTMREIIQSLDITKDSARTALRFLLKKGAIARIEFKIGKMGYSIYELEKSVFEDIKVGIEKGCINPFSVQKKLQNQKGSNSSNSYINITTTEVGDNSNWESIDVTPLKSIGFTKKYLLQLKNVSTPQLVQESIVHFAFALENNPTVKKYNNPIGAFMKVMKRGEVWIEPNYESPKDKALRELLERKKAQKAKKEKMINELLDVEFEDWKKNLTEADVKAIVPENMFRLQAAKTSALMEHFKNEILLPRLRNDGLL